MNTYPCPTCGVKVIRTDNDVVLEYPAVPRTSPVDMNLMHASGGLVLAVGGGDTPLAHVMHEHQIIPAKAGPEGFGTLGELISMLSSRPAEGTVQFDFSGLNPGSFHSWRMDYSQLCLDTRGQWPVKTGSLLAQAQEAIGQTFQGWKGGDYTMSEETSIVVAHPGDPGGCYAYGFTTIIGAYASDEDTVLLTSEMKI